MPAPRCFIGAFDVANVDTAQLKPIKIDSILIVSE